MSADQRAGLTLDARAREALRRHGEDAYPRECCGFLVGTSRDRTVVRIQRADNERTDAPRTRYLIPPDAYLRAVREAEAAGFEVMGFYHSHPEGKARPSEYDRAHALPGCSYLILEVSGGRAGDMRSWTLAGDRSGFDAEPLAAAGLGSPRAGDLGTADVNRRTS